MDKDILAKIQNKLDLALKANGIDPTIEDFKNDLKREGEKKYREDLAIEIKKEVLSSMDEIVAMALDKVAEKNLTTKELVAEAIKNIKSPEIVIPEIKVPTPKVTVNVAKPDPVKVEMPKEIEVKGFGSFIKASFEILKSNLEVKLKGIDKRNPLPVILCDEKGKYYKALDKMLGGGGSSINGLMNNAGNIINPATEDKQTSILGELESFDTYVNTTLNLATAGTQYKLPATEMEGRQLIVIQNNSGTDVYIGNSSVTTSNGIKMVTASTLTVSAEKDLYAVCGSSDKDIIIMECK